MSESSLNVPYCQEQLSDMHEAYMEELHGPIKLLRHVVDLLWILDECNRTLHSARGLLLFNIDPHADEHSEYRTLRSE